jgi:hypothetical protein
MLTDPRLALAEQSNFIGYLLGLAGAARAVHALAADGSGRVDGAHEADDFTYLLLAVAGLGEKIERLAGSEREPRYETTEGAPPRPTSMRWLR